MNTIARWLTRLFRPQRRTAPPHVRDHVPPTEARRRFDEVCELLFEAFGITPDRLRSPSRRTSDAWPRQLLCYVMREKHHLTLFDIGELIGRDHSTVHHAWTKVRRRMAVDPDTREIVAWLMEPYEQPERTTSAPPVVRGSQRTLLA